MSAGSRGTTLDVGPKSFQCHPSLYAGKRKANEVVHSGNPTEHANGRSAPGAGSAHLPAFTSVTGEQAALADKSGPRGGVTYPAVLARLVAPIQPSGSLKPTSMDSYMSVPAPSSETGNSRMSSDVSGPLSDKPDGISLYAQVVNACLPAGERPNRTPIFISGFRDTHAFVA